MGNQCLPPSPEFPGQNNKNHLPSTIKQGAKELKLSYLIDDKTKVSGLGGFGKVFHTHNIHNPALKVAIKVLDKKKMKNKMASVMEEIRILIQLDHPNIVKYYETYEDEKHIYLVMEYLAQGDLESKLKEMPNLVL